MRVNNSYNCIFLQVFEFHGCFYHGCPKCYNHDRNKPLYKANQNETMDSRLEATETRSSRLRGYGFELLEMWECEFRKELRANLEMEKYTGSHPLLVNVPLDPLDAFYGGRTGNCKTFYKVGEGEKIRYLDVCSLYPWVRFYL